jgi:molecular chaperone GrpE
MKILDKTNKDDNSEDMAMDNEQTTDDNLDMNIEDDLCDEINELFLSDEDVIEDIELEEKDPLTIMQDFLLAERDRYLRLAAEYDNYRKRNAKERESIRFDVQAELITRLLPVYDNLERALKAECVDEAFYKGVEMTMTQMIEIFDSIGVIPIPAVGELFDPNYHNAVMTVENPDFGEKTVAEELQKGFMLGDKVIRFSTVVVAN